MAQTVSGGPTHIKDLTPDPANRRSHNPRNIGMVVDALHHVGAARSIVIDEDNVILAGNGVTEAAAEAGITKVRVIEASGDEIIAVRRRGLTDEQKRYLAIADNRSAELAQWNAAQFKEDLAGGKDFAKFFSPEELQAILGQSEPEAGLTDADAVPSERPTGIKRGDLYELGRHRLLCGDSSTAGDVARLLGNVMADALWTDPPYGVSYVGKTKDALRIANDGADGLGSLLAASFASADAVMRPGCPFYIARPAGELSVVFGTAIIAAGWHIHEELQWVKDSMVLGHSDYHLKHETVVYGWKPGEKRPWFAGRSEVSVFEVARPKASPDHPTGKPVDLIVRQLKNSTGAGSVVLDIFGGSGSTLIACEQLGRDSVAVEIEPRYAQVIIDRWEAFTGQKAVKVGDAAQ